MVPRILIVLTSRSHMASANKRTGWFLPEFAHPYYKFEGKAELTIVSPEGGEAPLDPSSVEMFKQDEESIKFLKEQKDLWSNTQKLSKFLGNEDEFDAIFFVGGHGPMFDLAVDPESQQLIKNFYEKQKIVAAVCHGQAALVDVKLSDGSYLLGGQEVTSFTNVEEDQVGLTQAMPFLLETRLRERGAKFSNADAWAARVVISGNHGNLITGQNPASASSIGEAILAATKVT